MENNEQDFINIINATENNLKHVSKFCAAVFAQIWPPGSRPHGKSSGHDRNRSEKTGC